MSDFDVFYLLECKKSKIRSRGKSKKEIVNAKFVQKKAKYFSKDHIGLLSI